MPSGVSKHRWQPSRYWAIWLVTMLLLASVACTAQALEESTRHYERGLKLREVGDLPGALKEFQATIKLDPQGAYGFYELAKTYRDLKQYEESAKAFERAIELRPKDGAIRQGYGRVLGWMGDLQGDLREQRVAVQLEPEDAVWWLNLGRAQEALDDLPAARLSYERAYELDPNDDAIISRLGQAYANLGEAQKALPLLSRAVEMDAKDEYSLKLLKEVEAKLAAEPGGSGAGTINLTPSPTPKQQVKPYYSKVTGRR